MIVPYSTFYAAGLSVALWFRPCSILPTHPSPGASTSIIGKRAGARRRAGAARARGELDRGVDRSANGAPGTDDAL